MKSIDTFLMNLENIKKDALVYDIETSAQYSDGKEINIRTNFEDYLAHAKCKWIGLYSYKYNKYYSLEVSKNIPLIKELFEVHRILVSFNGTDFDFPILINNGLIDPEKRYIDVDCMQILGTGTFKNKKGFSYKNRGTLMDYKFKNNSLKTIAETMKLDFQKGDIDYKIFKKDSWTDEETLEIKKYLKNDVMATKQMFDKLWDYWLPFTKLLDQKYIKNLSWIRNSIASLIYKSACFIMKTEPTYTDGGSQKKERMGGNVFTPKYEEAKNVWYIDFTSLYPHIFCMFNLFDETTEKNGRNVWHGNEIFQAKGYYNISEQHILSKAVQEKLLERIMLKKNDPDNPMVYTIKIWLNGLYGIIRSAIFEKVHNENGGWDCCWLGQQLQELTSYMMNEFGFETIGGDTDSLMVVAKDEKYNNREYVLECLEKIIAKILHNVPFPVQTYNIDIERFCIYMLFPFSEEPVVEKDIRDQLNKEIIDGYEERMDGKKKIIYDTVLNKTVKIGRSWVKEWTGKKKNYMYIYEENGEKKIKLVGLPIMKDNSTRLGIKIYNEILKPKILETNSGKFSKEIVDSHIENYLKNKDILALLCREFKVKPFKTYKRESQIQAQISNGYFNGQDGIICLIKNYKIGKAGKGDKYCSLDEAIEAKLKVSDLDLNQVYNELSPFIISERS